jgi:hypothetical protein
MCRSVQVRGTMPQAERAAASDRAGADCPAKAVRWEQEGPLSAWDLSEYRYKSCRFLLTLLGSMLGTCLSPTIGTF